MYPPIQDSTHTSTKEPSDAGATQDKTSDSSQQGSKSRSHDAKPAAQASRSLKGSISYSRSSSGSGGDDGDDNRRRNVPTGGCQGDGEEPAEEQPEKQRRRDGDHSRNQDSMATPAKVPSDTGTTQGNNASSLKESQMSADGGKPTAQASNKGSTDSHRNSLSSGSGGDDGDDDDDDKKKNVPAGGCRGNGQCVVENEEESEQNPDKLNKSDDDDNNKEKFPKMADDISVGGPALHGDKKISGQVSSSFVMCCLSFVIYMQWSYMF